jgi:hypothetical protein
VTKRAVANRAETRRTSSARPTIRLKRLGKLTWGKLPAIGSALSWSLDRKTGATKQ